mgnify:CR=1 FL=1|tara:strand:- start:102 stop:515 length:414 start_codon:yes stop_codon:yes gene_type:complete
MTNKFNISIKDAWELLNTKHNSFLIDVRSTAEWSIVGIPDLSSIKKNVRLIEWTSFPDGIYNSNFINELSNIGKTSDFFIFICRSGARSLSACYKAYENGYTNVYNLNDGFEGPLSKINQRSQVKGWKHSNLPWYQN